MHVADRTRKRTIGEMQNAQCPSASQVSPPMKKARRTSTGSNSQNSSTPLTQEEIPAKPTMSAKAVGKRRRRLEVPTEDNEIATKMKELQEQYDRLSEVHVDVIIKTTRETEAVKARLTTVESEVESKTKELTKLQQEHEALKKSYEEKLAAVKNHAADATKQLDDRDEEIGVLREERDAHKRVLDHVLSDPRAPHQVRSVVELDAKILQLKSQLASLQDDLHVRSRRDLIAVSGAQSEMLSLSKAELVAKIERMHRCFQSYRLHMVERQQARAIIRSKMAQLRDENRRISSSSNSVPYKCDAIAAVNTAASLKLLTASDTGQTQLLSHRKMPDGNWHKWWLQCRWLQSNKLLENEGFLRPGFLRGFESWMKSAFILELASQSRCKQPYSSEQGVLGDRLLDDSSWRQKRPEYSSLRSFIRGGVPSSRSALLGMARPATISNATAARSTVRTLLYHPTVDVICMGCVRSMVSGKAGPVHRCLRFAVSKPCYCILRTSASLHSAQNQCLSVYVNVLTGGESSGKVPA